MRPLLGRCINCFHDFSTGPCGGCGAVLREGEPLNMPGAGCEHLSSDGVDQNFGPDKVWRCLTCGWLHCVDPDPDRPGISKLVPAVQGPS